jgi:hypothetical protein
MRHRARFLLSPLLALLVCEGAVRYYQEAVPAPANSSYLPDAAAGFRLRPSPPGDDPASDNHVNAFGFRDREHPLHRSPGTRRILGVGDSHVYGAVAPPLNFLRVAQAELARTLPTDSPPVEMLLMGCPGWNTDNEAGIVASLGPALAPDLVVLCFSVDTDVTGNPVRGSVIQGNLLYTGAQEPLLNGLRKSRLFVLAEQVTLRRVTAAARRLGRALTGRPSAVAARGDVDGTADPDTALPPPTRHYLGRQVRLLPLFARASDTRTVGLWREPERQLDLFAAACRATDTPWVLLVIPAEIQVDAALRRVVLMRAGRPAADLDFDLPQRRLAAWARTRDVALIDPLAALRAARAQVRLYVPNNSHWNVRGNALAGELLAKALAPRLGDSAAPPRTGSR